MKKIVSLLLAVMLAAMCCSVFAAAEDIFTFHIDGINGTHKGEDNFITTNAEALAAANTNWAITLHLKPVEGNVYEVAAAPIVGSGDPAVVTLGEGEITFSVHSSGDDVSQYANADEKTAARGITVGTYFVFKGVTTEQIMKGELPEGATVVATSTKPTAEPATSEAASEAASEPVSEETSTPATKTENKNIAASATVLNTPSYENPDGQYPSKYTGNVIDGITGKRSELGLKGTTWAAFYKSNDGGDKNNFDGKVGEIVLDFGAKKDFTSFKTHIFGSANSGIAEMSKIEIFVSDDNKTWTSVGAVTEGLTGEDDAGVWVELKKAGSGRYVKYAYTMTEEQGKTGVFLFVSECEAYANVTVSGEASEKPVTPAPTSDNGIVALAVISAIAVAGAVIVKKSR